MSHPYFIAIQKIFEAHQNSKVAKSSKAYLLNQFEFYGIRTPLRRKLCHQFYKENPLTNAKELETLVKECFGAEQREMHYFAIELLGYHKNLWSKQTISLIEWMITHKSWWDSVDSTNSHIIGKFFLQFPNYIPSTTLKWNKSSDLWLRRMSILFQLLYKEKTQTDLLSKYIENCQLEQNFFIRKAIGWALRSYAYTHKKWVIHFVKNHPLLSTLSKREALKHC